MNDLTLYFKQTVLSTSLNKVTETDNISCVFEIVRRIEVYVSRKRHTAVLLAPVCDHEANSRYNRPLIFRSFFLREIHLLYGVLHFRAVSLNIIHRNSGKCLVYILTLPAVILTNDVNKLCRHIFCQPPAVWDRLTVGLRNIEKVPAPVAFTENGY
ncbi:MAG: hypothetical protein IJ571_10360 [Ruminococcus sp.]|nr:hypothetical protein [Ruminococcus sp.]